MTIIAARGQNMKVGTAKRCGTSLYTSICCTFDRY